MKLKYCNALFLALALCACEDDPKLFHDSITELSNDCIKRSLPVAPNIVNNDIEFAYAMAIPKELGKLTSAQVVASIAGEEGTHLDPNSYYTNNSGQDIPVRVASDSQTTGETTSVEFTVDTCASTLRYYYRIPEAAKGKDVKFTFSVKASNGQTVHYNMGPYKISKMDMTLRQTLSPENCFISFRNEDEAVHIYSAEEVQNDPSLLEKIDLMYAYSTKGDISHAIYTASSPVEYMDGVSLPAGFVNDTKLIKIFGMQDRQLADLKHNVYVDDLDFQTLNMNKAINYLLGLKEESGIWVETADGKYRAYVYVNKAPGADMIISVKRYPMK